MLYFSNVGFTPCSEASLMILSFSSLVNVRFSNLQNYSFSNLQNYSFLFIIVSDYLTQLADYPPQKHVKITNKC
jgi:hypothetical protein